MGALSIRWIGQGGYLLRDGDVEICIDPYLSNVVDRVAKRGRMVSAPFSPEELKSDVTVCTHDHLDHLDPETVSRMKEDRLFVTTSEGTMKMSRKVSSSRERLFDSIADSCFCADEANRNFFDEED